MANPNTLENFLAGRPLSKENAALMEGREPIQEFEEVYQDGQPAASGGTLTQEEREWIRRLVREPGFPTFIRLLNSTIQKREDRVRLLSTTDPLKDKEEVIREWAYISCFKAVLTEIQFIVKQTL
jgi:hypothetical protein